MRRSGQCTKRVWERTEYPYFTISSSCACAEYSGSALLFRSIIYVSVHPELTQVCRVLSTFSPRSQLTRDSKVCRVLSTFSPRSQLTRDSKVCRVLSTFSPSSGGSSASNLLEPSRTTSSTPNSCKNSTRPAISVMLTPPPRSDRVRSTVVQAHLTSSNLLEPHHYRDSLLPLAIANNALHCTSTHPTNVHMYVHLLGTCMYNVPLYIHPTNTHTEWVSVQEMFISCC